MNSSFASVKLAYQREQKRAGQLVRDAAVLPVRFGDLTDEWLTGALCRRHAAAQVVSHRILPAVEGTTNRCAIELNYNAAGQAADLPTRVFCKAAHGLENRYALGLSGAARTEVVFYNALRPLLVDVRAPDGVFAHFDPESLNYLVILKDLSDEVLEFCTQETPVSRARVEDMVGLIAGVHAQGYANASLRGRMSDLSTWPDYFRATLQFGMREGSEEGFARASDLIPPRLHRRAAEVWPATVKAVQLNEDLPWTLHHGDVHLKNWYITRDGHMALGDWQCATRAHWGRDFGYTIATALTIDDRRAWEQDLLRLYLDRMHAAGGPKVTYDDGWQHYRQHLLSALTWWTITYNPAPGMPDMQPMATAVEFVKRLATAIDDIETLDSLR